MIEGLSPNALYTDSVPCHDFRDPDTWQNQPAEGWTTGSTDVEAITLTPGAPVRVRLVDAVAVTGMHLTFSDVGGCVELNGQTYTVTAVDDDLVDLDGTDGAKFTPYTSGGSAAYDNYDSSFTIAPSEGLAMVVSSVWLKMSQNARMHSPFLIIYKAKNGAVIKQTTYVNLDDFLDRFTTLKIITVERYANTIEFYEYMFPQPLVLRSATAPEGAFMPYFHSLTIKIEDDQPYKNEDDSKIEFCRVRYPDVQVHLDTEYAS